MLSPFILFVKKSSFGHLIISLITSDALCAFFSLALFLSLFQVTPPFLGALWPFARVYHSSTFYPMFVSAAMMPFYTNYSKNVLTTAKQYLNASGLDALNPADFPDLPAGVSINDWYALGWICCFIAIGLSLLVLRVWCDLVLDPFPFLSLSIACGCRDFYNLWRFTFP